MAFRACMMHSWHSSKEQTLEKLLSKCDLLETRLRTLPPQFRYYIRCACEQLAYFLLLCDHKDHFTMFIVYIYWNYCIHIHI